ncbi:MAG TPA: hypothetical protein VNQ77_08525 [Frankiaceae bacterium]|nr:hypothetical protein [Frankiaceae bacterium]
MKALLCALLAAAAVPASAGAAACPHTDPRGDVMLAGLVTADAPHVDLIGYDVTVGRSEVVAVLRTAAGGTANARWSIEVTSHKRRYYFTAYRAAAPFDDPRTIPDETTFVEFDADVTGTADLHATGTVSKTGEVRIRVPLRDYGSKAPKRGSLRDFSAWAYQRVPHTEMRDTAQSRC